MKKTDNNIIGVVEIGTFKIGKPNAMLKELREWNLNNDLKLSKNQQIDIDLDSCRYAYLYNSGGKVRYPKKSIWKIIKCFFRGHLSNGLQCVRCGKSMRGRIRYD